MALYQGSYSNFAAKRAARHGRTKQYKAALEQKQNASNSDVKQVENTKNTPTTQTESKKDIRKDVGLGHPEMMAYPSAKGMEEITGDSLLIKCFKYVPPSISATYELEQRKAPEGGGSYMGQKYKGGQTIMTTKNGKSVPKLFPKAGSATFSNDGASKKIKGTTPIFYVELPIPQDINDSNSVTWSDDNMNIFQIAGLAAVSSVMKGEFSFEDAKNLIQAGIGADAIADENLKDQLTTIISGKAIDALGNNVNTGSALGRQTGSILNSNLELLFNGVNLRTFPFSINFSPRTKGESDMVKFIIRAFKSSMAAKKNSNDLAQGGAFLSAPDVFSLEYRHKTSVHPFLNSFKHCALTGMNVNYTQSGTYATYGDGTPVNLRMNLTFKELNPIYFEDYAMDQAVPHGVGY